MRDLNVVSFWTALIIGNLLPILILSQVLDMEYKPLPLICVEYHLSEVLDDNELVCTEYIEVNNEK